jgi:decaprenylphospho-beta-D-erythro-pentofuranosid-2-ulose 2-reductase
VLAGPDEARLVEAGKVLAADGVTALHTIRYDVRNTTSHDALVADAAAHLGSVDLVVVASGVLGTSGLEEITAATVSNDIITNFAGPAAVLSAFASLMVRQGYGQIIVFSSVAGVRVRRANFVYGASKAGLDGFCQGLSDALFRTGVELMIVRPGFVHSKMTRGLKSAPFAVGVDAVASSVVRGLESGAKVVWCPQLLRFVFTGFRILPQALWRRLPM